MNGRRESSETAALLHHDSVADTTDHAESDTDTTCASALERDKCEGGPGYPPIGYEDAIEAAGYGRFHYMLLAVCGWSLCSDSVEILCASFVLPAVGCDMDLTSPDKGWLNSVIFIGMMIGGYFWGSLADHVGRRQVLMFSLTVNALGGLSSSVAQTFWLYMLCRLISGIGVGGSMPVIFTYYTEFQPKSRRGPMISFLATFWMCGNILTAALAWLIIPHDIGYNPPHHSGQFSYNSWRIFVAVCTFPALSSALIYMLMPESPRYLMQKGREQDAQEVFYRVQRRNRIRNSVIDFRVQRLIVTKAEKMTVRRQNDGDLTSRCSAIFHKVKMTIIQLCRNTGQLFLSPLTKITIVFIIIFFTLQFGYYGLFLWFPELFKRMDLTHTAPCDTSVNVTFNETCFDASGRLLPLSSVVYFESFLTAASNLPGNLLTILFIDRVGRKILLVGSMVLSGVSVFFIYLVRNHIQSVVMSCVFSGISVIGFNVLDVIGMELYPTQNRSTANGLMSAIGRIAAILGNQAFGQLLDADCAIPMVLVAVLLNFGGLCAIILPNKQQDDLS